MLVTVGLSMALSPRLIRRRIRSVHNTKKITKAMELVAAAKMRRAVAAAHRTRAYANLAWRMVGALEGAIGEDLHPLLRGSNEPSAYPRHPRSTSASSVMLYIIMASDRGLCGGFNAQLFRAVQRDAERGGITPRCVAVGKKAEQFIHRQGWELSASFTNISVAPTVAELRPIARLATDAFTEHAVDEVRVAFTNFISSLRQQPRVRTLLPLQRGEEVGVESPRAYSHIGTLATPAEFLFAPGPQEIIDAMLPRLVELQVYQAFLETGASEHSARMFAMRNASDAAKEMIDGLTLTFNQSRQAMITREIAEISAGRAAIAL